MKCVAHCLCEDNEPNRWFAALNSKSTLEIDWIGQNVTKSHQIWINIVDLINIVSWVIDFELAVN